MCGWIFEVSSHQGEGRGLLGDRDAYGELEKSGLSVNLPSCIAC